MNDIGMINVNGTDYKVADAELRYIVKNMKEITSFKIVDELPTTNINPAVIYLILKKSRAIEGIYEEYVYILDSKEWEKIGETSMDFSDFVRKDAINVVDSTLDIL